MLGKFINLLRHTLIYGLGNYGIKVLGFLLIPLYTRLLSPSDYGIMGLVTMYAQALFIFTNLGQSSSVFRFYYEHDTDEGRERVIAAAIWIVLLFSVPITVVFLAFPGLVAQFLLKDDAGWFLIFIATATVLVKVLVRMPFSLMRAKNQSKQYASWAVVRNSLTMVLAILLVIDLKHATGIILSQFLGELLMCCLLTWTTFRMLRSGFHWANIKEQLSFGLPLVPAGVAAFALNLVDRWFINHYYSLDEVGLYQLGFRFAEILIFVVTAFQLSWPQFLFSNQKDPKAPQLYAQMASYYAALILFLWLGLSIFAPELIRLMAAPDFQEAATVVPIVAFAMALNGMRNMVNIGPPILKKTIYRTYIMFTAALVGIGLNFLLIPHNWQWAAWAACGGFLVQLVLTWIVSQRLYHVPHRYRQIGLAFITALALYGISWKIPEISNAISIESPIINLVSSILFKTALLLIFPVVMLAGGFIETNDLAPGLAWLDKRVPHAALPLRRAIAWLRFSRKD